MKRNTILTMIMLVAFVVSAIAIIVGSIAYTRERTARDIMEALDLHDKDFIAEADSTGNNGLSSMAVYGTVLEDGDFALRAMWARDGEVSEEIEASTDKDFLYVGTKALISVLMPESEGLVDGQGYIETMYDEIFGEAVTAFPLTGNERSEAAVSHFKETSSILYKNTVSAAVRYGRVEKTDEGLTLDLDARATAKLLEAIKSEFDKNSRTLTDAAMSYSLFEESVINDSPLHSEFRKAVDEAIDELAARAIENDAAVHAQIRFDGSAYIEVSSYDAACNITLTAWDTAKTTLEHPTQYDTYHHQLDLASSYFS